MPTTLRYAHHPAPQPALACGLGGWLCANGGGERAMPRIGAERFDTEGVLPGARIGMGEDVRGTA